MKEQEKNNILQNLLEDAKKGFLGGLYHLPAEVYHHPQCPGISRSGILKLLESAKHYQHWLQNPEAPTKKMEFGSDAHCAILEPEIFEKRFTFYPKDEAFEGRSKAAIQAREDFQKQNHDKKIISAEDYERIGKIMEAAYRCEPAAELLKGAKEQTKFWTETQTGVLCRVRPDCLQESRIIDLKITGKGSLDHFQKTAAQLDYHIQAAFYLDAFKMKEFIFLCIEDEAPYEVSIFELDEDSIELGRAQYLRALQNYTEALKQNDWKGYPKKIQRLRLPQWKFYSEGGVL